MRGSWGRRGSVLILVLWTTAFIAFLAVTLAGKVRQNVFFFQKLDERERVRLAAEAGVKSAIDHLRVREPGAPFSLQESYAVAQYAEGELNQAMFKPVVPLPPPPDDQQNQAGISVFEQNQAEIDSNRQKQTTTYGIMDESRKINLNRADRFFLMRFLTAAGLDSEAAADLAGQIVDYRDADDAVTATVGAGGSEESRYHAAGLNYPPKNSDYEFVSELLRLPGMTREIYARIRFYVTVYGDGAVNLNSAGPELISLLDLHPGVGTKILALRAGPDEISGTADDVVFQSQADLELKLKSAFGLRLQEQVSLRHAFAKRSVALSSNYFSVVVEASAKQSRGQTMSVYGLRRGIQRWMESS